jgi:hypothetical protein
LKVFKSKDQEYYNLDLLKIYTQPEEVLSGGQNQAKPHDNSILPQKSEVLHKRAGEQRSAQLKGIESGNRPGSAHAQPASWRSITQYIYTQECGIA